MARIGNGVTAVQGELVSRWISDRRIWLLALLVGTELATLYFARSGRAFWPVAIPWLVSMAAAVAFLRSRQAGGAWRLPGPRSTEFLLVAGLTLLAAALRLPGLERMPGGIYGDEGEFAVRALDVTQGGGPAPFGVAFLGDPALYIYLLAPFVSALGTTMEAVRLPSALAGAATVPILYGLVRDLYGRDVAALAALLLATSAVHIHFSRLAVNVVWVPFFACLSLWLLKRGLERRDDVALLLAGISSGLGVYSHFGARLILPILLLILVGQFAAAPRAWRDLTRAGVLTGFGALLALAPLLAYMSSDPRMLTRHTERRGIWEHWEELAERYGTVPSDKFGIIVEQIRRTFGAFVSRSDPLEGAQFYTFMDASLLSGILGPVALLGLLALCLRLRTMNARLVLIWFCVPVIFASVLTDVAGQSHRLIHPLLPALIGAALVIDWIRRFAIVRLSRPMAGAVVLSVVLVTMLPGLRDTYRYFQPDVTARFAPRGTAQARCLEALPDDTLALVLGAPRMYAGHGPSRYLGHAVERRDVADPAADLPADSGGRPMVVMIHERNIDELPEVMQVYPDAAIVEIDRPDGKRVLTVVAPQSDGELGAALLRRCESNAGS
jgi:4-amino-4-deoxy-L-arabinose transferase-like glycosyltransferase